LGLPSHAGWVRPTQNKKNIIKNSFFIQIFCGFIQWRQSQEYRILWIVQYLPTPELEIFIGLQAK
jgi:hypothetical protein